MKKHFIHIFLLFIGFSLHSQTPFETEVSRALKLIERSLTISGGKHIGHKNEFFLYSISLDSNGKISFIEVLRPDSISHMGEIKRIASEIKEKWTAVKSDFKIILIPVLIMHPDIEENDTVRDLLMSEIATYFDGFNVKPLSSRAYIARNAMVTYYRSKNNKN